VLSPAGDGDGAVFAMVTLICGLSIAWHNGHYQGVALAVPPARIAVLANHRVGSC
jgi:hypothetical protein